MGLYRGPEADQVGSGVRERQVSSGAADEGVQDSALVHVLQVAQVFTQVLLRGVALRRDTAFTHSGWTKGRGGVGVGEGSSYLLRLVLGDVMQGAVRVQAHPHHPHRELGRPLVGLQLGGWKDWIHQSESGRSKTSRVLMDRRRRSVSSTAFLGPEES